MAATHPSPRQALTTASDAELIAETRAGNEAAYGELFRRHERAARNAAWCLTRSKADADDIVAEVFTQILAVMQRNKGPELAFRPYLLTCVRNACTRRGRGTEGRSVTVDPMTMPEPAADLQRDELAINAESDLIAKAFYSLPERWQWVLWQLEVDGRGTSEVADELGIAPSAAAALSYRARKALSEAYLAAHLVPASPRSCRDTIKHLPGFVRSTSRPKEQRTVEDHLASCASCRAAEEELRQLNRPLRESLVPAVAGITFAAYLMTGGAKKLAGLAAAGKALLTTPATVAGFVAVVGAPILLLSSAAPADDALPLHRPAAVVATAPAVPTASGPGSITVEIDPGPGGGTAADRTPTDPSGDGLLELDPVQLGVDRPLEAVYSLFDGLRSLAILRPVTAVIDRLELVVAQLERVLGLDRAGVGVTAGEPGVQVSVGPNGVATPVVTITVASILVGTPGAPQATSPASPTPSPGTAPAAPTLPSLTVPPPVTNVLGQVTSVVQTITSGLGGLLSPPSTTG